MPPAPMEHQLSPVRKFLNRDKRTAYEKQGAKCARYGNPFDFEQMEANHIVLWSPGGRTVAENCQMLCRDCHRTKSDS